MSGSGSPDLAPEVMPEQVTFDDLSGRIHVQYLLRTENENERQGHAHIRSCTPDQAPTEVQELWEACVALIEKLEEMEANPPMSIPTGRLPGR